MSIAFIVIVAVSAIGLMLYKSFFAGKPEEVIETKASRHQVKNLNLKAPPAKTRNSFKGWSEFMEEVVHPGLHFRRRGSRIDAISVGRHGIARRNGKSQMKIERRAKSMKPRGILRFPSTQPVAKAA